MKSRNFPEDVSLLDLQRFQLLVDAISDYAIYMLDIEGKVVSWNTGAQRFKGYEETEIMGHHFSRFFTEEDRAAGLPKKILSVAEKEGRFESEGWRVRKDGSRFWANVVVDAIRSDDGRLLGFAKITRDITEKRTAAEMLKRTEKALQHAQKMESIGKLTGGVAHDFNNLLQIISGNLQLLALDLSNNERTLGRIDAALDGVSRGKKLASYLLAFGRRQALDPKVVNLGRHVAAMEDMLRRTLGESIEIEMIVSGGLWNTQVDVAQVESALLNLAINARDAMESGGKLTIEIGNAFIDDHYVQAHPDVTPGQYVMICVSDTGTGIPENLLAQVFDPFFSTKPEGKGSGLGLSMVYGFVKQSGGHVQIYSEIDHGTSVKIYLPRSLKAEESLPAIAPTVIVGGAEVILVAEDDIPLCTTVVEMLRELGYQVFKAHDAASALAIIESGVHVDLLFTDVVMPGPMRSTELVQKAKALDANIGILFTSGYTQNAIVHGGRLDPGVELLSKPYTREALARKIRHVLANQKHIAQLKAKIAEAAGARSHPAPAANAPANTATRDGSRPLHILLVEDESIIRLNTTYLLQKLGHTVVSAASKNAAIAALQTDAFDVLLTDVQLPDASGIELAREAKNIIPHICVVYATGQDLSNEELDGAIVLNKPYNIGTLKLALRDCHPVT